MELERKRYELKNRHERKRREELFNYKIRII